MTKAATTVANKAKNKAKTTAKKAAENLPARQSQPKQRLKHFAGASRGVVKQHIDLMKNAISDVIPGHLSTDRILQMATTMIMNNGDLAKCTVPSTMGALMQSQILGLDITPTFGEYYFIPRKNGNTGQIECTGLIGYKGLIKLAENTGKVATIYAYIVYENDKFDVTLGLERRIEHKPAKLGQDKGEPVGVYAVVKFKDGSTAFEVLDVKEIMDVKAASQSGGSKFSPWNGAFYLEMWKKTAIRRVLKYVPMSAQEALLQTLASDERVLTPDMFIKDNSGQLSADAVVQLHENEDEIDPDWGAIAQDEEQMGRIPEAVEAPPEEELPVFHAEEGISSGQLQVITHLEKLIKKYVSEQAFYQALGNCGLENLDQVNPDNVNCVIESLREMVERHKSKMPTKE